MTLLTPCWEPDMPAVFRDGFELLPNTNEKSFIIRCQGCGVFRPDLLRADLIYHLQSHAAGNKACGAAASTYSIRTSRAVR
jgi:hypothetical protein